MDIGNLKNNYTFYEGYEDEDEIVLYIETDEAIHIWEGYSLIQKCQQNATPLSFCEKPT